MKNLPIIISLFVNLICMDLFAQQNQSRLGITFSPYQAFTKKGEMQMGVELPDHYNGAWELNLGFRFKGSDDPHEQPYFNQLFHHTSVGEVSRGVQFFFFLPIPVSGRDKDWTEKQVHKDYYLNSNVFVSAGYKIYLIPMNHKRVQGGLYLTPGITIGGRKISEYVYATGQKGYVTVLDKDDHYQSEWGPIIGFYGTTKVVKEDVYDFSRLEIKKYSKTYLQPNLKLGYQLPIGSRFSIDMGAQATLQGKWAQRFNGGGNIRLEPTAKLGVWF